jgi:type III pantothenate kinase
MKHQNYLLLFDIGNTHTHVGLATGTRVLKQTNIPTHEWFGRNARATTLAKKFAGTKKIEGAALCSVVPRATPQVREAIHKLWKRDALELNAQTTHGVGIDYPKPQTIGADRLANSVAAFKHFGAPVVVVDFGTAVTFDVVNAKGNYAGGIIAPGLAAMTDYLHEKTALLPRIKITEPKKVVGKSTEQAMLAGAVYGYRGLVRELISELKRELKVKRLPVVATGGYARLIATGLPEISAVDPALTLEGLRLVWQANQRSTAHRR